MSFPDDRHDAPLEPALQAAARAYHVPPPVPADAMWRAIEARRGAESVAPPTREWARPTPRGAALAAAAAVLLAVGVGLGRYSTHPSTRADVPASGRTVAATLATNGGTTSPPARPESPPRPDALSAAEGENRATYAPTRRPDVAPSLALGAARRARAADVSRPFSPSDAASAPLRAATDEHLAHAEALLTAFGADDSAAGTLAAGGPAERGGPAGTAPDSAWARDLLGTTRLLLDSPAGRDPARRALLETLELVLVQIARLPRADTPDERAFIERAIRRGDLMARLRSAVPSGSASGLVARGT